jgi:hypothetical protein
MRGRKKAFLYLGELLRSIEADKDDLASVRALNLRLLKEVMRDEGHILRLRDQGRALTHRLKTGRLPKSEASQLRQKIAALERRVTRYYDQIYFWRCFGDGLAYAYISSFNIKHVFFDTTAGLPKQESGFISGKAGLEREVAMLEAAIAHGVPAVLSDLTNIVRYGDVCLLGGEDPVPIEVKSRKGLNQRGLRQAAKLAKLTNFLETDQAQDFRGVPQMRRRACDLPYQDHIEALNACVERAHLNGHDIASPEPGLVYAAYYDDTPFENLLDDLAMSQPTVFLLNLEKAERNWAPYLPFVNSIRDLERLHDFVVGELIVYVVLDLQVLCDQISLPGWRTAVVEDFDLALVFENPETGAQFALSRQFIGRIGFEFASSAWIAEHGRAFVARTASETADGVEVDAAFIQALMDRFNAMPRIVETLSPATLGGERATGSESD